MTRPNITFNLLLETIMLRLKEIEKNHQEALESIQLYLNCDSPEMVAITKLLLETDVNPYSFLPHNFAGVFDSSYGFNSLLNTIHHALVDDGDISFPIVNKQPKISFVYKHQDNYVEHILTDSEKEMRDRWGTEYTVEQCKDVFDFIEKFETFNNKEVYRWFVTDAARFGIDWAAEKYEGYARYNWDWETDPEVLKEIEEFRDKMIKSGLMKDMTK